MRSSSRTRARSAYRCRVRGHEAHSSLTPRGVNAVQIACEIVTYPRPDGRAASATRGGFDAAYDVPYTTVHTGVIRGGTALNIVPRDCSFDFEFRHLPFDDPRRAARRGEALRRDASARDACGDPGTVHRVRCAVDAARLRHAWRQRDRGARARRCSGTHDFGKVSFGTEASLFHGADMPTIICGPGHIEQAHQPNEWVALEQLALCESFMQRLADALCAT